MVIAMVTSVIIMAVMLLAGRLVLSCFLSVELQAVEETLAIACRYLFIMSNMPPDPLLPPHHPFLHPGVRQCRPPHGVWGGGIGYANWFRSAASLGFWAGQYFLYRGLHVDRG